MDIWMALLFLVVGMLYLLSARDSSIIQRKINRLDYKINLMLKQMNISVQDSLGLSERVKEAALDPTRKIEAIKTYVDETGSSLLEAKEAVEAWIECLPKKK